MTENIKINVTKKLIVKPENLFVATISSETDKTRSGTKESESI